MTTDNPFSLTDHCERLYAEQAAQMAAPTHDRDELLAWQQQAREKLTQLLGIENRPRIKSTVTELETTACDGYSQTKIDIAIDEGVHIPVYILTPEKAQAPYRPIVVTHGHNPDVQYILGNFPEGTAEKHIALDRNYAQALAQAGFLVYAIEQRGFGQRKSTDPETHNPGYANTDRHLSFLLMQLGRNLLGERVRDVQYVIDVLQERDDIVPNHIGCTGNSGGGTTTIYASAIDERITISVPASAFSSYKASIIDLRHCECNYIPGITSYFEMGDVLAMVAPRRLCVITGEHDHIYPADPAREQFKITSAAYALLDKKERTIHAVKDHGHQYNNSVSHAFFNQAFEAE